MHSVETLDTTPDFTVPSHLQALFDTTLNTAKLSPSNKQKLALVLQRNSCAFATDPLDLGYCDTLPHDINTGNAKPIKQSPRRPPLSAREAEDAILDEMLKTGVIEPSNSPWSSPVCLVKKRDETYRFCIDYRRVNDVTKKDAYPLPDIKDALDSLKGARYYATIDLLNGYWQLPMTERAKERSAFLHSERTSSIYKDAFWLSQCTFYILSFNANRFVRFTIYTVSLFFRRYYYFCG